MKIKRAKKQQYINSVGYVIKVHRLITYLGLHSQKGDCFDPHMHLIICDFSVNVLFHKISIPLPQKVF